MGFRSVFPWLGLFVYLLLNGCRPFQPDSKPAKAGQIPQSELIIALELPASLDPIFSVNYAESEIVLQMFDGLLRFDNNLNIAPALAQDWRIDEGGRRYRFQLKPEVKFHHGRIVEAQDFVYSLTRLLSPGCKSPDAAQYLVIEGARDYRLGKSPKVSGLRAISPTQLEIRLEEPFSPFLSLLALQTASVVPRELVENGSATWASEPSGTGPFRLVRWEKGKEIILSSNKDYYLGAPHLQSLHIKTVPALGATRNFESFLKGEVDLSFVPTEKISWVKSNPAWQFLSSPILRLVFLGFNWRNPLLREARLRRQIASLLDPSQLIGSSTDYLPIFSLLPFSLMGSLQERARHYNRAMGNQGMLLDCKLRAYTLCYAKPPTETRRLWMDRLLSALQEGGLQVRPLIVSSFGELQQDIMAGKADMFIMGEIMDFPDPYALLYRLFFSTSEGNLCRYRNPEIDRLLQTAQKTQDEYNRASLYKEIERRILDDCVVVPLFTTNYSIVLHRKIKGLYLSPLGFQYLPLRTVWIEN
jgi:oligopeptide transport system substrate-binding protein